MQDTREEGACRCEACKLKAKQAEELRRSPKHRYMKARRRRSSLSDVHSGGNYGGRGRRRHSIDVGDMRHDKNSNVPWYKSGLGQSLPFGGTSGIWSSWSGAETDDQELPDDECYWVFAQHGEEIPSEPYRVFAQHGEELPSESAPTPVKEESSQQADEAAAEGEAVPEAEEGEAKPNVENLGDKEQPHPPVDSIVEEPISPKATKKRRKSLASILHHQYADLRTRAHKSSVSFYPTNNPDQDAQIYAALDNEVFVPEKKVLAQYQLVMRANLGGEVNPDKTGLFVGSAGPESILTAADDIGPVPVDSK